jgi:hypothetical protein
MRTSLFLAALACCGLAAGSAGATVVKKKSEETVGAASGGVDVPMPKGKVRVQCWQHGEKIIDDENLSVMSLGLNSQANAITFGQNGPGNATASLITQNLTSCLLKREE